jgi:hypothetical protein
MFLQLGKHQIDVAEMFQSRQTIN